MSPNKIEEQRKMILQSESKVKIFAPCKLGEGILSKDQINAIIDKSHDLAVEVTFFIPASGSGSRMFQFIYDFLNSPDEQNSAEMERFMNHLKDFAFYYRLPLDLKYKINAQSIEAYELAEFLLSKEGLNFTEIPKGLIPFHFNEPFVQNAFQDHLIQGVKIASEKTKYHFTIQPEFESEIKSSLHNLEGMTGAKYDVGFSYQNRGTDSVGFREDGELVFENDNMITRPAGHGALLQNLNEIDADVIFIKNIDNVQHFTQSSVSQQFWTVLGNILLAFRKRAQAIYQNPTIESIHGLNAEFQFLSPQQLSALKTAQQVKEILNRPIRVCGMVKNEGQPGGGPFWIEKNGEISKQIIEKAQIAQSGEQLSLMIKSTHFNPVMIAASIQGFDGEKFELDAFSDKDQFFVVNKTHKGQPIRYVELPGLWNGGMAKWNSIFVEAPKESFSPVKNVLDLLEQLHLPKQTL